MSKTPGMPSIEARGGLKIYMESLGEPYEVVEDIMKNDIIIYKASHIRRALGNRYSLTTCKKWADQWIKEHKLEQTDEKENSQLNDQNVA